jgi:acetylornithine/N-succinyldiaminopimelate aminotransferase
MDHVLRCYDTFETRIIRGEGCTVYDESGKGYVDFEAGVWCAALGHGHPRILAVLHSQTNRLIHVGYRYPNPLTEEAASAVLSTLGLPDGKCTFLSSGSEAVEFAVQAIRRLVQRPRLLTFAGSYLSAFGSAGHLDEDGWCRFDWTLCFDCSQSETCDSECPHVRELLFSSIAGMVLEPGSTHGEVRFPPNGLVDMLVCRVKAEGGMVLANEVTTGLGRTGLWYGYEHYAVKPDIVALGKALGNGCPVSAVAMTAEAANRFEESGIQYVQSHQNDPLACAVAAEVVSVLRDEGLVERSDRVGRGFLQQLKSIGERHNLVRDVRGRGLMLAVELAGDDPQASVFAIHRTLLDAGYLVGINPTAHLLRFYPPLTIGETEIIQMAEHLDSALAEIP